MNSDYAHLSGPELADKLTQLFGPDGGPLLEEIKARLQGDALDMRVGPALLAKYMAWVGYNEGTDFLANRDPGQWTDVEWDILQHLRKA